eukprot:6470772-Amphidinium_carterae.1
MELCLWSANVHKRNIVELSLDKGENIVGDKVEVLYAGSPRVKVDDPSYVPGWDDFKAKVKTWSAKLDAGKLVTVHAVDSFYGYGTEDTDVLPPSAIQDLRQLVRDPAVTKHLPAGIVSKDAFDYPGHIAVLYSSSQFASTIDAFLSIEPQENHFGFRCNHAKHRSLSYALLTAFALTELGFETELQVSRKDRTTAHNAERIQKMNTEFLAALTRVTVGDTTCGSLHLQLLRIYARFSAALPLAAAFQNIHWCSGLAVYSVLFTLFTRVVPVMS